MYKDFDSNLREIGVGDLSVGKKIYQMSEAVAGRINAYNNSKDNKELIYKTLSRNIYGLKKNIDKKTKSIMVQYFLINLKNIKSKNLSDIKENSDIFFDLEKNLLIFIRGNYMAVPKKKFLPLRRGKRRSHHALSDSMVMECPNCGAEKRPHHVCLVVDTTIPNR